MKLNFKNKKADIESLIYIVVFMFAIGIAFFLISNMNSKIFTELDTQLNESHYNGTQAMTTLESIQTKNSTIWDYAFIGIFLGSILAIGLSAYAVRISPIFFWIYGILSMIVLALGVILSNTWQDFVADPDFATTLSQFPMTNAILGSYYPLATTALIIIMLGFLFGKPPEQ